MQSCLHSERKGMRKALLEVIASKTVSSQEDIYSFVKCTLLAVTQEQGEFEVRLHSYTPVLCFLTRSWLASLRLLRC